MARRILITGGSGFIGTNLVEACATAGHDVVSMDVLPPRNPAHRPYWRAVDLLDADGLADAVRSFSPEQIYHLAARTDLHGTTEQDYAANIAGVENLIAAAGRLANLECVAFASSRLVCRIGYQPASDEDYCPTTPYGRSKMRGELLVRQQAANRFHWFIVRPTSIWGPWFDIPYKPFFTAVARGRYLHPDGRRIEKSFGHVGNSIFQLQRLLAAPAQQTRGRTFYLADHEPIDLLEMAVAIQDAAGARPVRNVPYALLKGAAYLGDAMKRMGYKEPPITTFRLDNLVTNMVYDLKPVQEIVGALPFSMREGVGRTVAWMRSAGQL
ncbi:MAG TPA: NAD(P)-dependent oxidoreductase [Steroidobacteraceae bacterium]|nr:NAD(P)-dependent oxidoreductase [Steroidobacteraceae bacterium]